MPIIDIYTVSYASPQCENEWAAVYAYQSGGVGVSVSDPGFARALCGVHEIAGGMTAGDADVLAQRVADVIAYLTDGTITHEMID